MPDYADDTSKPGRKEAMLTADDKPPALPPDPAAIPATLKESPVWVCWRWTRVKGRWTKPPISARTLQKTDVTDPVSLSTFDEALARVTAGEADGIGVALAPASLLGVDLDDCRDPGTGEITAEALATVAGLDSYSEVSPSGTGVKVLVRAAKPGPRCRVGNVELYDAGRYFTLTGRALPGCPPEPMPRQDAVDALYARLFPSKAGKGTKPAPGPETATDNPTELPDDELLRVAFRSKQGESIRKLWEGDTTGYGSASEADLALCSKLAFYFPDPERLAAVFGRSALARDKWDRPDYRAATVAKALEGRTEFYKPRGGRRGFSPGNSTGAPSGESGGLPEILIGPDQGRVNDEAAASLANARDLYQRGGVLVQAVEQDAPSPEDAEVRRAAGALVVRDLPPALLQDRQSRAAVYLRAVERKEGVEYVKAPPPAWCVAAVHARGHWPAVPVLAGVVTHPVFLPDGTMLVAPGYHRPTGLLVRPPRGLAVSVPESPTLADAKAAMAELVMLVGDFPFQSPVYEAAWLAALLTLPARSAFCGSSPLFLFDGNTRGVGKGLLADVIALVVLGVRFPVMSYTPDAEEMRKRITSLALEGERSVLLDNLSGPIGNGVLDAALTTDTWRERILGGNRTYNGPLDLTWFATGNNCELRADTGRRTCHIRLETPDERPELKSGFRHPKLRAHVREHRAKYLSCVLTILRAWHVAGRPCVSLPAWGSFEEWSDVVRSCVVWLGLPDPGETRQELLTRSDRDAGAMGALLQVLRRIDPSRQGRTAGELIECAKSDAELRAAIDDVAGKQDARLLGYRLRSFARRVFDGLFLDHAGEGGRGVRWAAYAASDFRARHPAGAAAA